MSGEAVVYRTPVEDDARFMVELLAQSGIAGDVRVVPDESGQEEALLLVPAEAEEQAVRGISEHLEGRGLRPEESGAAILGDAVCPNCASPVPAAAGDACRECGYEVQPSAGEPTASLQSAFPDARTCCADCCVPSTKQGGSCPDCAGALEPVDPAAPACPAGTHMLVKGEAPGWVCPGCRTVWLPG